MARRPRTASTNPAVSAFVASPPIPPITWMGTDQFPVCCRTMSMLPAVYQRAPNLPLTRYVKYVIGRNTSYTSASR
jgi:hypothetical protein